MGNSLWGYFEGPFNDQKWVADMTGIKAIADALSVSSSMNKLNVLSTFIGAEGGQALVDAAPPQLQTFCGFEEGQTDANLSNKRLGPGEAVLLAWELTNGYVSSSMTSLNLASNDLTQGEMKADYSGFETDMTG